MNRLLFAAARGARIQCEYLGGSWIPDDVIPLGTMHLRRRIHPDDAHLQYGPISTELRRYAEHGGWSYSDIGRVAQSLLLEWAPYPPVLASDLPHFQLLALLLAEHFADEGM